MTQSDQPHTTFAYEAQTNEGEPMTGAIDGASVEDASRRLRSMQLRIISIEPIAQPTKPRALRGDDFVAFNQQLAQLTQAGLPVERGLRLIAQDMRSARQGEAVRRIAAELEKGTPLGQAFASHRGSFPPLYGQLIDAGVRAGDLPGMLLNLGRHIELVQRLRAAVWRAASYPLMVMVALLGVIAFISLAVLPQFAKLYVDLHVMSGPDVPGPTAFLLGFGRNIGFIALALLVIVILVPLILSALRKSQKTAGLVDRLVLPLPIIGPILRWNLVARWCDALHLAVRAGLDLPAALAMAGEAVASPRLKEDGRQITDDLKAGLPIDSGHRYSLLPAMIPAAMQLASTQHDLPSTLGTLAQMYQQQAEVRLAVLPTVLTPALLIMTAGAIGFTIVAMFLPLMQLIQAISAPHR